MNSDKHKTLGQRGNALIYVIIAIALLGALTMLLAKQDGSGDDLGYEQAELLTTRTIAFAGSAKNVVDQMLMSGTNINNLSFVRPNQASFEVAPHINKVFHPDGGGLNLDAADTSIFTGTSTTPPPGWYMGRFNNVVWTPTATNDIILAAFGISQSICESINYKITGSKTIPALGGTGNPATYFVDASITSVPNAALTNTVCAACENYPTMCVSSGSGTYFTYYNIISAQ